MDFFAMEKKVVKFIEESGISAFDLCRVAKGLCCCRTCYFFAQHYDKKGEAVDFGHCTKNNMTKQVKPNMQSCGFWSMERCGE